MAVSFATKSTRGPHAKPGRAGKTARGAAAKKSAPKAEWKFAPTLGGSAPAEIQTALEVGPPDDDFEREADHVADRIMTMPATTSAAGAAAGGDEDESIQRQTEELAEGSVQTALQRACTACAPDDDEAHRMQRRAMPEEELQRAVADEEEKPKTGSLQRAMDEEDVQRATTDEEEISPRASVQRAMDEEEKKPSLQRAMDEEELQRACASCEEEPKASTVQREEDFFTKPPPAPEEEESAETVQAKGRPHRRGKKPAPVPDQFKERLDQARRGGGEALPDPLRTFMESRFGESFSRVRVHRDAAASTLAESVSARAFTLGRHVFFKRGEFQPHSQQGQRLVAHELTHTLQQRGGLHSVQREILEPEVPEAADKALDEERTVAAERLRFEDLAHRFGWRASETPPFVLAVLHEILGAALRVIPSRESLAVFVMEHLPDASIRRMVRSSTHELRLELNRTGDTDQGAVRWELKTLDGTRAPATGGQPIAIRTDEDAISVGDTGRPKQPPKPGAATPTDPAAVGVSPPSANSTTSTAVDRPAAAGAAAANTPDAASGAPRAAEETPAAGESTAAPAAPEAAFPASPAEDPNFQAVKQRAGASAEATSEHGEAGDLAANAKDAAAVTSGEQTSQAQGNKADQLQAAKTGEFNKEAFVRSVLEKVRATAPKDLQQAAAFKRDQGPKLNQTVNQAATQQTDATAAELNTVAAAAPDTGAVPARPDVPLAPEAVGGAPPDIKAEQAVPPERPPSQVEGAIQQNQTEAKQQLDELGYTDPETTFANSNDPEMLGTLEAKKSFDADAAAGPVEYREGEAGFRAEGAADASALGQEKLAGMFGARKTLIGQVAAGQTGGKTKSETKRQEVVREVNGIFTSTDTKVKTRLGALKETVFTTFRNESQVALDTFTDRVVGAERRWNERSFLDQTVDKIGSALLGIPTELEADLQAIRDSYIREMTGIVERLAVIVERELNLAKEDIAAGRKELKTYLDGLGPGLDELKASLSTEFNAKFDSLDTQVKDANVLLVNGVAEQYRQRLEEGEKLLTEVRERNHNLFDDLAAGISAVREKTLGVIQKLQQVFADGVETLMKVLDDPITFAKNFLSGIMQGFEGFVSRIGTHLKAGLIEWLTGSLAGAGVTLPTSFDVKGIVGFILQLLGLTVDNVKARARVIWGDKVVSAIERGVAGAEKALELFNILRTEGVGGLFNYLAAKFTEFKDQALGTIRDAIGLELVQAAVKKIVSLLIPGGAFLQAILSIVDAVFFFIRNADRFATLVQTITNAVKDILAGNVGALASKVESVLASTIPIVLDFLATLIGIGGKITDIIKKALKAVTQPIQDAIDAVLLAIKKAIGGLIARVLGGGETPSATQPAPKGPMTTDQIIAEVVARLEEPTVATEPAAALEEKKQQAVTLKEEFQPSAPEGKTLQILFNDKTPEDVDSDHEVDMEVGFSPGKKAKSKVGGDFWPKGLEPRTDFPALVELDKTEKEQGIPDKERSPSRYLREFNTIYEGQQTLKVYANGRAARKLGRLVEGPAIAEYVKQGGVAGTTKVTIFVKQPGGGTVERVPDFFKKGVVVGDVKNVKTISLDDQMRDNQRIMQGKGILDGKPAGTTTDFHLLVRKPTHEDGSGTHVSDPLRRVLTAKPFEVIEPK